MLAGLGCEAPPVEVTLDVRGECGLDSLVDVRAVSIEVYGSDEALDLCTLGRRCVFANVAPTSIEEVSQLLRDGNQPLVDAELAGAEYVHVVGHVSCFPQKDPVTDVYPIPPTCGANDLAEVDDGTLAVTMQCDGSCPAEPVPLCN